MRVQDLMNKKLTCCGPDTNLAEAAGLMWNNDCGVLPVVEGGKLVGVVTDRDICIALGTRNRPAAEVLAKEVATGDVRVCAPDDDVHTAMATMRRVKVHRLPVVGEQGNLEGILTLNDLILAANPRYGDVDYDEVMNTIKAVSEHRGQRQPEPEKLTFPAIPVAVA